MPVGYLVTLGDYNLDTGDTITDPSVSFITDSVIGAGSWLVSGTRGKRTLTDKEEKGDYYLATDGNVYFVPDRGVVDTFTSAEASTAPTYTAPAPDGIITGTAGDDVIDASFVDEDGEMVDNADGTGPAGNEDIIQAGDGNDTIAAGAGNDTVYGEAGNDTINGGAGSDTIDGGTGNDTIHGDSGTVSQAESLNWLELGCCRG